MTTLSMLPPELLVKIIAHALTTSLLSPTVPVHNQFANLTTTCRTCAYRNIAGVSRVWRAIAQEVLGKEVTLANGRGSAERDEQVVKAVEGDSRRANNVRSLDASLRRAMCSWGAFAPLAGSRETVEEATSSGGDEAFSGSRQVQAERWHTQCLARERQRFVRLLQRCKRIHTLDVDVGFFQDLRVQPSILPLGIRTLTLRNCDAADTFALLSHLPQLQDLTLRLALDWSLPPGCTVDTSSLPPLQRFELSTTAFGVTSLSAILTLLAGSRNSLTSLALRNKGASDATLEAFLPVATGLIEQFAPRLKELSVRDIPRCSQHLPETGEARSWFPSSPTRLPYLEHLHLTGVPLPSASFFAHTLVLPPQTGLRNLTIEDFHAPSLAPLLDALRCVPALQQLEALAVACARSAEMGRRGEGKWEEEERAVEAWCEGRERGRSTWLKAGWRMVRVERCGW